MGNRENDKSVRKADPSGQKPLDFNPSERLGSSPAPSVKSIALASSEVKLQSHSGYLPPASLLKEYDEVLPGLAERIVQIAEKQFEHRLEREKSELEADIAIAKRTTDYVLYGQVSSLIVSLSAIGACVWVAVHGQPWVATALGTGGFVSLINGIIQGKRPAQLTPTGVKESPQTPPSNSAIERN